MGRIEGREMREWTTAEYWDKRRVEASRLWFSYGRKNIDDSPEGQLNRGIAEQAIVCSDAIFRLAELLDEHEKSTSAPSPYRETL